MEDGLYSKIHTLINEGNIADAEQMLDAVEEKDAQWHYLSSHIFLAKNWTNESRKQLEIAIGLDPENEQYKRELELLKRQAEETLEKADEKKKKRFGKECWDECPEVCCECCCEAGVWSCCSAICEGCGN